MYFRTLQRLSWLVFVSSLLVSGIGLFYHPEGQAYDVTNLYGESIRLYGRGLYAHDTYFRAPIFRGTDATILFLACPVLLVVLIRFGKGNTVKNSLLLTGLLALLLYYAANIAFGVAYNNLHLLYTTCFGLSLFAFVVAMMHTLSLQIPPVSPSLPLKGITIFLVLTGLALFAAWLPDILTALSKSRPPAMIETYTTEVTYVLDMGVIAPLCFICRFLLRHQNSLGLVLLDVLLTVCLVMGVMLPVQTAFQWQAGITLPIPVLVSKVGSFCLLALFALYFKWRLLRALDDQTQ